MIGVPVKFFRQHPGILLAGAVVVRQDVDLFTAKEGPVFFQPFAGCSIRQGDSSPPELLYGFHIFLALYEEDHSVFLHCILVVERWGDPVSARLPGRSGEVLPVKALAVRILQAHLFEDRGAERVVIDVFIRHAAFLVVFSARLFALLLRRGGIEILHGEMEGRENLFRFAAGVAVEENFAVFLLRDGKAVFPVIVGGASGGVLFSVLGYVFQLIKKLG